VLYAVNLILQRRQAQVASPTEIAFFQNLTALSVLLLGAPFLAVVPDLAHLPGLAGSALLSVVSLLLLSWAYARAEAQVLVPVEYTAFIWASLLGWLAYNETVTATTILGTALIVAGCIIAARRRPVHVEATAL
jgi:S-adenosylmethionine uptake transporter